MSTTNAGSLGVVVEADTASFDSSMSKVGAAAEREMKRVEKAQASAKAEGDRFVSMLQRQVDTFGLTGTALLAYEARLKGVSSAAQPLIDKLNAMKAAQQGIVQSSAGGAGALGKGMAEAAEGADKASHASSGLTRELIVLAHEASQGNFKRFGGSLLVLAEYSSVAQKAIAALFGPIGVVAAGLGLFALAAYEGSKQADVLNKSLLLTGDFAGVTAGSFDRLSKSVSAVTGSGIGKAGDALHALVETGEVGPKLLADMAEATVKLEALTGKSADEIAKDFAKMQEAPTKWAAEANKAYNFLSAAQYDHIKRLDEEGQHEQASIEVLKALNDHLGSKLPESLSGLGKALHSAGLAWDDFWHSATHVGAPATIQDQIDEAQKRLADLRHPGNGRGAVDMSETMGRGRTRGDMIASTQAEISALQARASAEDAAARATAEHLRIQKEGIAASDYFSRLQQETKGVNQLAKDLAELDANEKKRAAERRSNGLAEIQPGDAAEHDRNVAYYQHKDRSVGDKSAEEEVKRLATSIRERLQLYDTETAKLKDEAEQYQKYGKVLDATAEAVLRVELASGKFAKASASDKAALLAKAQAEDMAAAIEKQAKADAAAAEQHQKDGEALAKLLRDQAIATDIEVEKLQDDTKFLSLNTLERNIAIEALKIEKERRDELANLKNAGHADEINTNAAKRTADITAALTAADTAQKQFGAGASKAFAQYEEAATNAGKFAEGFVSGSLSHIEDSLAQFAETGKLSFKSLFTFMADEFIRNQIRMQITGALGGGGASIGSGINWGSSLSLLGSLGGGTGAGGLKMGSFSDLFSGDFMGGALAGGIDSVPYNGMPAVLHEGERVMSKIDNQQSRSGAGGASFDFSGQTINVGQGVSRAEVYAAVQQAKAETLATVNRQVKTGRLG